LGRTPSEIHVEAVFVVPDDPVAAYARWQRLEEILARAKARREANLRDAYEAQSALDAQSPEPPLITDPRSLIADFITVARLAGHTIAADEVGYDCLPAPHSPPTRLPTGMLVTYAFACGKTCLIVGKAVPKTHAWYTKLHYRSTSANTSLARSMLKYARSESSTDEAAAGLVAIWRGLNDETVGDWLQTHATRYHFFLDATKPSALLLLLEAFLQCRLSPLLIV